MIKSINRIGRIACGGRIRKLNIYKIAFYPAAAGDPAYPVNIFYVVSLYRFAECN
jgi:hypothetical protein